MPAFAPVDNPFLFELLRVLESSSVPPDGRGFEGTGLDDVELVFDPMLVDNSDSVLGAVLVSEVELIFEPVSDGISRSLPLLTVAELEGADVVVLVSAGVVSGSPASVTTTIALAP